MTQILVKPLNLFAVSFFLNLCMPIINCVFIFVLFSISITILQQILFYYFSDNRNKINDAFLFYWRLFSYCLYWLASLLKASVNFGFSSRLPWLWMWNNIIKHHLLVEIIIIIIMYIVYQCRIFVWLIWENCTCLCFRSD